MTEPLVSVLIPTYNAATTIERALESILTQTYKNFEVIIVDDGSADDTPAFLSTVTDKRVRIYKTKNRGIARALNFGLKLSKGEYIARMDADDYSYPNRLKLQVQYLNDHPDIGLVGSLVKYAGDQSIKAGYARYVKSINALMSSEKIYKRRFQESPFAHPSVTFRKSLVHKYGGYNENNLPEDFELWLRLFHHDVKMAKVEYELIEWSDPFDRLSRTHSNYSMDRFYEVKAHYFMKWLRRQDHYSQIWIFGTGKHVNKRLQPFLNSGLNITKYIDVKHSNETDRIHYSNIPKPSTHLILSFVSDRKGKVEIEKYLNDKGYEEGVNYFLMS